MTTQTNDSKEVETVWVLAAGEYSDYRVMCACPSKEEAETTNLWDNGKESETKTSMRTVWPFADYAGIPSAVSWRWVRAPVHNNAGGRLTVEGIDHERVRKVFSERRAEIIGDETNQMRKVGERVGGA